MWNTKKQDDENSDDNLNHRQRIRQDLNGLVEDIISDGASRGLFDNLKGKGKPLNLTQNGLGRDMELAHSLLKENDIPPAWIMQRNDILAKQARLRTEMERQWSRHETSFRLAVASEARGKLTISWDDVCLGWQTQIDKLNQDIRTYNLKRPSDNLELFHLNLQKELERIGAPRWLR